MKIQLVNGEESSIVKAIDFKKIIRSIFKFFKSKNMELKPYPSIVFDCKEQKSLVNFIIGVYFDDKKEVHLFVTDRAPNDIVRTLFHELVHHWQNISGKLEEKLKGVTPETSDVGLHEGLTEIEREANDKGFCLYREWARIQKGRRNPDRQFNKEK